MLKKNLLVVFLASVVVGGIAIKTASIFYEYSTPVNQSKVFYKEKFKNDTELSISNIDISKDIQLNSILEKTENPNSNIITDVQISAISEMESSNINISENTQINIISKSDNSNNDENNVSSTNDNSTIETSNTIVKAEENANTNYISEANYPTIYYDRTTSIYDDDGETLLRVEYYSNNKLVYYSDVEQFNATTNSYIEKIFQWNYEKDMEALICTNIYSNGRLINSY